MYWLSGEMTNLSQYFSSLPGENKMNHKPKGEWEIQCFIEKGGIPPPWTGQWLTKDVCCDYKNLL